MFVCIRGIVLSLQARIKGHAKKLDKARAVADSSQTDCFDQRLAARERGELEGTHAHAPDAAAEEQTSRIHLQGTALVFLDVDGTVSALAGGIQDELLWQLRQIVRSSGAELVLTSQWRRDARLMRMLNAALGKLEMPVIRYTTSVMTFEEQQTHGVSSHEHTRVYEVRKFLKRCGGGGVCGVPWIVLDTADLASGTWLAHSESTVADSTASRNPASRRGASRGVGGGGEGGRGQREEEAAKQRAVAEPFSGMHFVMVEGVHGLSPGLATRALNCLRFQAVGLVRANNLILCSRGPQDAELAFAMGTHYRLGENSTVNCLRRDMTEFLRMREGRGRRGGTEALRSILSKHVSVPGDYDTIQEAMTFGGSESHLTLHITLGEGTHILSQPLQPPRGCRIVIRSALLARAEGAGGAASGGGGRGRFGAGLGGWKSKLAARGVAVDAGGAGGVAAAVGASAGAGGGAGVGANTGGVKGGVGTEVFGVRLVVYGGMCVVSVKDVEFVNDPFCKGNHPAMAQVCGFVCVRACGIVRGEKRYCVCVRVCVHVYTHITQYN